MTSHYENKPLNAEEKEFIQRLATHYTPAPMTPAQQGAFDRDLEERITRRARPSFFRPAAVITTACAALLLWFTVPHQDTGVLQGEKQPGSVAVTRESTTPPESEEELLTYAYYDPDFYGDENDEEGEEGFLPDDYEAIVSAFALPDV